MSLKTSHNLRRIAVAAPTFAEPLIEAAKYIEELEEKLERAEAELRGDNDNPFA